MCPRRVSGRGRGERVLDVHARPSVEGGREEVGVADGHRSATVTDDHELALRVPLEDDGFASAAHPALDQLVLLLYRAEDDVAGTVSSHPSHERIVRVQDGIAVA